MNSIPNNYITRKFEQIQTQQPAASQQELTRKVLTIVQQELIQWIFYLTPEEWRSTGLVFSGVTPDPHDFNLAELNQMARTIQIYLPASIKRLKNRYKIQSNFQNIVDPDKAPFHPCLEEVLQFFKTQCKENGWPWPHE